MLSSSLLTIDLNKIRTNLQEITSRGFSVMPMIKGNAYGTDPDRMARFYAECGVPIVGVSQVCEAVKLREAGLEMPIFVLSTPPFEAQRAVRHHLQPAISSFEEANALNSAALLPIEVHLHIDTGMNRFGIHQTQALELASHINKLHNLKLVGVMTHLVASEKSAYDSFSYRQLAIFRHLLEQLPVKPQWIHAASSGGSERFDLPYCNLARIGRALIHDALTLETRIVAIHEIALGETVGYDRTYTAKHDGTRIAVLPIGYHDGYPRSASNRGYVIIHGKKAPLVGLICMDFMMVDITHLLEVKVGERVILMNEILTPHKIAKWANTNVREILSHFSTRIERRYIYDNSESLRHTFCSFQASTPA